MAKKIKAKVTKLKAKKEAKPVKLAKPVKSGKGSLVIVESPTKAKTIDKFLGDKFDVVYSMGHIVDLPKKTIGIDIDKNFEPEFDVMPEKRKIVAQIIKAAKDKENIYLATDPDREGEAISWHIKNKLLESKAGKDKKYLRVAFHEITKEAIEEAFKNPQELDQKKVDAQQARRVLDRVVGYKLSPFLWKKISRGLSAGRVQSVALRLIVERERAIRAFKPQEYWEIEAELKKKTGDQKAFIAKLDKINDKKLEINNQQEADSLVERLKKENFVVVNVEEKEKRRHPAAPFTTSTLQQEAFNKLRFNAHRTMMTAQGLYEGVELGQEGPVGLITYMRTDSVNVAATALGALRIFIEKAFGKQYLPEQPNLYKSKKRAQEAHEAIRPTNPNRTPESLKDYLSDEQFQLYELIWKRFVASQMTSAIFLSTKAEIKAAECLFGVNGSKLIFDGFLKIYIDEDFEDRTLPKLEKDEILDLLNLNPSQHFTKPPARYSDASLVKELEENGIGRPSTYAPTIYTIVSRGYVIREQGYLSPTELGEKVVDLLLKFFSETMDYEFTAKMEMELDEVESGEVEWHKVLQDFYPAFKKSLDFAQATAVKEIIYSDKLCPQCGNRLIEKFGRQGKFLSCSQYPKCKYAQTITTGIKCPNEGCVGELVRRRSKMGRFFYGCSNYPKCNFITNQLPKQDETKP